VIGRVGVIHKVGIVSGECEGGKGSRGNGR
jgi:hypothetical protein